MATKRRIKSKYITPDGYAYLTKRLVVSKAQAAGKTAAAKAMSTMGYVITVRNGWVIRENQNGTIQKLTPIGAE